MGETTTMQPREATHNLPRFRFDVIYAENLNDDSTQKTMFSDYIRWNYNDPRRISAPYGEILFAELPENSWEAVKTGREIAILFQNAMKQESINYLEETFNGWFPEKNDSSYYVINLVDTAYPVRVIEEGSAEVDGQTISKNLFSVKVAASDFTYTPNYIPNIHKIFHPQSETDSGNVISLVKKMFQRRQWTNRFTKSKFAVQPFHNINSTESNNRNFYGH